MVTIASRPFRRFLRSFDSIVTSKSFEHNFVVSFFLFAFCFQPVKIDRLFCSLYFHNFPLASRCFWFYNGLSRTVRVFVIEPKVTFRPPTPFHCPIDRFGSDAFSLFVFIFVLSRYMTPLNALVRRYSRGYVHFSSFSDRFSAIFMTASTNKYTRAKLSRYKDESLFDFNNEEMKATQ